MLRQRSRPSACTSAPLLPGRSARAPAVDPDKVLTSRCRWLSGPAQQTTAKHSQSSPGENCNSPGKKLGIIIAESAQPNLPSSVLHSARVPPSLPLGDTRLRKQFSWHHQHAVKALRQIYNPARLFESKGKVSIAGRVHVCLTSPAQAFAPRGFSPARSIWVR